jgi:NTE family protein
MSTSPLRRRDMLALASLGSMGLGAASNASAQVTPARPASPSNGAAARQKSVAAGGKIGIALGGGSARGFAHIGVLQALDEAGIPVQVVAGTSAGSLVGVFYAAGYTPWQMQEVALKVRDIDVADLSSGSKRGMMSGSALQKTVNEYVRGVPIEKFKLPFGAVACDLSSGEAVVLRSGDAGAAVRASCAIPGVFIPSVIGGKEMVDGGLVSPLPVSAARQLGADVVIAVDVSGKPHNDANSGLYEVLLQSFEIMARSLTALEAQTADVVIRPNTLRFSSSDFGARKDLIQAGYEATVAALPAIRQKLGIRPRA